MCAVEIGEVSVVEVFLEGEAEMLGLWGVGEREVGIEAEVGFVHVFDEDVKRGVVFLLPKLGPVEEGGCHFDRILARVLRFVLERHVGMRVKGDQGTLDLILNSE